jgi:branched-chain amino acid transport system permease protein
MVSILSIFTDAVIISALYAMVAIGFTLIFGVGGILNFAHGSFITLGGFTAYMVANTYGLNPWIGLTGGFVVGGIIGAILYMSVFRFTKDRTVIVMIVTLLIGFFIEHSFRIFVTSQVITISPPIPGATELAGEEIQYMSLLIFAIAWAHILGVFLFVTRTKTGKAILATSMSSKGSKLVGIEANRVNLYTWTLAGAFAGIAGVLLTILQTGQWNMGMNPLILSFAIVILGGLGSIRGSVVGAHIIGLTETLTVTVGDPKYAGLSSFVLLVVFLLVKPEGILGRRSSA